MAIAGFLAEGFRRWDSSRERFLRDRVFAAAEFPEFFDFRADAFFVPRDFVFLDVPTLRAI